MTLTDLSVVDGVEENHRADDDLKEWRNASALWLRILVLPSPEATTQRAHQRPGSLLAARQPGANFADFHLTERSVS